MRSRPYPRPENDSVFRLQHDSPEEFAMNSIYEAETFTIILFSVMCLSVLLLLIAVCIDFFLFSRKKDVRTERKSLVETGSMTFFFLVFYILLASGAGIIHVESLLAKKILALAGTIMIATGSSINIASRFHLGKNWANQIKIYRDHNLVRTGFYRIVRHPLYASIILMFIGACIAYRNVLAFLALALVFVPFMRYRARQEEKILLNTIPAYQFYKDSTGIFFPKLFHRRKKSL
jgi:protein-S-isoprenylcysteine O-methyltransferase Ste14